MKNTLLAIVMLFVATQTRAQRDAQADRVLRQVSAKYKSYKSLTADFQLIIENKKSSSRTVESGKIIIKGNMYKLELDDQVIMSDGKSVWTYLKEVNEVQINAAEPDAEDVISPTRIFTIYESGFKTRYRGEGKDGNIPVHLVELVPEDNRKAYHKIQLRIDKKKHYIMSAKILNKDGTTMTYAVRKFNPDLSAPDNLFSFDTNQHPGIEVVDLR